MLSTRSQQTVFAALLLTLPFAVAQDPTATHEAQGPNGEMGPIDPAAPPPGAPDGASANQGDETQKEYPEWYSNDYDCVINCMQVFNGAPMTPNPELDKEWQKCILEGKPDQGQKACDGKYMAQNLYQGGYIAQLFYKTGSIYECDGKPCPPPDGVNNAINPDAASISADTPTGSAEGSGDHTATPAVSMPGLSKAGGSGSTTVATETASGVPAAEETGANSGAGRVGWNVGSGIAAMGAVMGAMML